MFHLVRCVLSQIHEYLVSLILRLFFLSWQNWTRCTTSTQYTTSTLAETSDDGNQVISWTLNFWTTLWNTMAVGRSTSRLNLLLCCPAGLLTCGCNGGPLACCCVFCLALISGWLWHDYSQHEIHRETVLSPKCSRLCCRQDNQQRLVLRADAPDVNVSQYSLYAIPFTLCEYIIAFKCVHSAWYTSTFHFI